MENLIEFIHILLNDESLLLLCLIIQSATVWFMFYIIFSTGRLAKQWYTMRLGISNAKS